MTTTELIERLKRMPKDTPIIGVWWEREEFFAGDDNITDKQWAEVCDYADRELNTEGWTEDIAYLIDDVTEG